MVSDYLKIYLDDTIKLAKTLVIKSDDSVEALNDWVALRYGPNAVDYDDPTTWKYYQNICGLYHDTDLVQDDYGDLVPSIVVKSLDEADLETGKAVDIYFTRENLEIHVATRKAYQYGTRYYYSLVNDHPDKEQLILGILYPADMATAIAAKHGTILAYPEGLVEPQEASLIQELSTWTSVFNARWHVKAFGTSDGLYPAAQHAIMYLNLVPKILNLRLRRCKTPEAHSFHIREYLASHGGLDRFLPYMTLKQRLFLYRNLLYIERHVGKKETFYWLLEKLLTDRRIPLAEYSARLTTGFNEDFYPGLHFRRKPLNPAINGPERDYFSLDEVLKKELSDAWFNKLYVQNKQESIDFSFKTSVSTVKQTKLLESIVYDYNNVAVYRREDIVINHWAEMSSNGHFVALVAYKDPVDGSSRVLNAKDAFIYFMYCVMRSMGVALPTVSNIRTNRVLRQGTRTIHDLTSLVNKKFIDKEQKARQLLDDAPEMRHCVSVSMFGVLTGDIYDFSRRQWRDVSQTQNYIRRVELQNMYTVLYCDSQTDFKEAGMSYQDWLTKSGLWNTTLTDENYGEIAREVYLTTAALVVDETKLLKNIQHAMLSVMKQLTSYSLQYSYQAFDTQIKLLNWTTVRMGDLQHLHYMGNTVTLPEFMLGNVTNETIGNKHNAVVAKISNVQVKESPTVFDKIRHITTVSIKSPGVRSSFVMPVVRAGVSVRRNAAVQNAYRSLDYAASPDYLELDNAGKWELQDVYGNSRIFHTS